MRRGSAATSRTMITTKNHQNAALPDGWKQWTCVQKPAFASTSTTWGHTYRSAPPLDGHKDVQVWKETVLRHACPPPNGILDPLPIPRVASHPVSPRRHRRCIGRPPPRPHEPEKDSDRDKHPRSNHYRGTLHRYKTNWTLVRRRVDAYRLCVQVGIESRIELRVPDDGSRLGGSWCGAC
jgi:hypothetical protein